MSNASGSPPAQNFKVGFAPHCEPEYGNLRMGVTVVDILRVLQLADSK
jgi:hypothetical protein